MSPDHPSHLLVKLRAALRWSQPQLAAAVGVSRRQVIRWEAGSSTPSGSPAVLVLALVRAVQLRGGPSTARAFDLVGTALVGDTDIVHTMAHAWVAVMALASTVGLDEKLDNHSPLGRLRRSMESVVAHRSDTKMGTAQAWPERAQPAV